MAAKISLPPMEEKRPPLRSRARRRHRTLLVLTTLAALALYALYGFRSISPYAARNLVASSRPVRPCEPVSPNAGGGGGGAPSSSAVTAVGGGIGVGGGDKGAGGGGGAGGDAAALVPLEAHIMSKCPDARDCLRDLVLPAMIRVHDKVDFQLSYLGTPTPNDGVDCKHGPSECLGNILELCARALHPRDPKIWLGFTMCLTRDYRHIPQRELVEDCALEHAIDFERLNDCATRDDGAFGMAMLRDSVQRSADVRLGPR
ncbi:hypothetical protein GGR56DRAFT_671088 [Xylariaceae sp. FL0804]|nr:hypothetical protein GGR56DRAFT_671088 [Xylariaceae sp. FL0804]